MRKPPKGYEKGATVYCCYDGKGGRAMKGEVILFMPDHITVKFNLWTDPDKEVVADFDRKGGPGHYYFEGCVILPKGESLMEVLFGEEGDWYSVYTEEAMIHSRRIL
jgi:hypothetical protein